MYVFSIICFCDQKKALKRKQKQKQKQKKKNKRNMERTNVNRANQQQTVFLHYLSNIIMQQYQEMRKRQMMVLFNRTYQNKQSIRSIKRAIAE